jgi:hypothetical protein
VKVFFGRQRQVAAMIAGTRAMAQDEASPGGMVFVDPDSRKVVQIVD